MTHRYLLTATLAIAAVQAPAQNTVAPAQGAQPISRANFMQQIDNVFVSVDADKDGFLEKPEIEAAETKAMANRKAAVLKQREAAFRKLDANKDGNLSLQEFNSQVAAAPLPKPNAAPVLGRLDTNKDGKVSLAENRAPTMAQFDRADSNKDGTLSPEERRASAKK